MTTEASRALDPRPAPTGGRDERRAVRRYLQALSAGHNNGTKHSAESLAERIDAIDAGLATAEPVVKVRLIQERMDLYAQLKAAGDARTLEELEREFVAAAGPYSARKGISYAAWREVGVDHAVLEQAGITPVS